MFRRTFGTLHQPPSPPSVVLIQRMECGKAIGAELNECHWNLNKLAIPPEFRLRRLSAFGDDIRPH